MFRSAMTRESDLAHRRFTAAMDHWQWTADRWFDGTVASVDERLAKLDKTLLFARDVAARLGGTGAGFLCSNALPNLEQSHRELKALRTDLLNGFSDRQAGSSPAGRRTANVAPAPIRLGNASLDRAVELGSRDFLASQNTTDHNELITRARHYADVETSTLPVPVARVLSSAFIARITQLINAGQGPRQRTASRVVAHKDFDAELMFI